MISEETRIPAIISTPPIGEYAGPRKRAGLKACTVGRTKQPLQPILYDFTDNFSGHADVMPFALRPPLLQ
jgi:hypothetical protein